MLIKIITTNPIFCIIFCFILGSLLGFLFNEYTWLKMLMSDQFFCSILDSSELCNAKLDFQRSLHALKEF